MTNTVFCNIWPYNALRRQYLLYLSLNKALYLCDKGANQRSMHFPLGGGGLPFENNAALHFLVSHHNQLFVFVGVFVFAFTSL